MPHKGTDLALWAPLKAPASHVEMRIALPVDAVTEGSEFILSSRRNYLKPDFREMCFSYLVQQNISSVSGTSFPAVWIR